MSERLRLLIVDNSEDDTSRLIGELKRGGFDPFFQRVVTRESMTEALNRRTWDLVITDHNLPQFTSLDVLALTKVFDTDMPVFVVSGRTGEENAVEAMHAGAQDYIAKHNLTRLIPSIRRGLRQSKIRCQRRLAQNALRYLAYHDSLTGLVNRHEFENRLRQALVFSKRRNERHAMLYMDLDDFKVVNDTCGHAAGDEMLRRLSALFATLIRKEDTLARLGGDEFAVLLLNCPSASAQNIASNILKAIESFRFEWQDKSFTIGISIGILDIDKTSVDSSNILRLADIACYTAKQRGRNRICVHFNGDLKSPRRYEEIYSASRIARFLEEDRFFLNWQPIISLKYSKANAINREFFLRLRNETDDIVYPGDFIPIAERYNLMPALDRLVIDKAFAYLARNENRQDVAQYPKTYFINLSGKSLNDRTFLDYVRQKIDEYRLSPEQICFETSEATATSRLDQATAFIKNIKRHGFLFALDDFGVGLGSLSSLKHLAVDYIKIDGCYVRNIVDDYTDFSIIEAINRIGHANGIKTIAEYVETKPILDKVKEAGLDFAQGYEIERPSVLPS